MIVPFAIHPAAMGLSGYDGTKQADLIQSIGRAWLMAGLLIDSTTATGDYAIYDHVKNLSGDIRKEWTALLCQAEKKERIRPGPLNLNGSETRDKVLRDGKGKIKILYIDRMQGPMFTIRNHRKKRRSRIGAGQTRQAVAF